MSPKSESSPDPKPAGVKAVLAAWDRTEERGQPGALRMAWNSYGQFWGYIVACPGCGRDNALPVGYNHAGKRWQVVGGNTRDVSTLSLEPAIPFPCCGWRGWLKSGVFEPV